MAIYKSIGDPLAVAALVVMVVVFWLMDARYLQKWEEIGAGTIFDEPGAPAGYGDIGGFGAYG